MSGPANNLGKRGGASGNKPPASGGGAGANKPTVDAPKHATDPKTVSANPQVEGGGKVDTSAQDAKNAEQARLRELEQKRSGERRELLVGVTKRLHAWLNEKIKAHGELVKASQSAIAEAQQAERRLRRASEGADHQAFMDAANAAMAIVGPPKAAPGSSGE